MTTKIEWTGQTWNPVSGCSRKSAGCEHCYAETMTKRLAAMGSAKYQGLLNDQDRFNGVIKFDEKALLKPLSVKKPTTYFVNSMSDLFHENCKEEWIDQVFAVMALCPQHTFQILTKRADRMRDYFKNNGRNRNSGRPLINAWARAISMVIDKDSNDIQFEMVNNKHFGIDESYMKNIWLGVSVENQKAADERIPLLLKTPAAIRFLSCEPLIEKVDLWSARYKLPNGGLGNAFNWGKGVDWVIVGGESGHGARPCDIGWIRSIVQECGAAEVACFVKQLGTGRRDYANVRVQPITEHGNQARGLWAYRNKKGGLISEFPVDLQIRQMPI